MGEVAPLRIVLVGELNLYLEGLAEGLDGRTNLRVVGIAKPEQAVTSVAELDPDVVLLDLDESQGERTARLIHEHSPVVSLLVLGTARSQEDALAWAEAGVLGWTGRDAPLAELVSVIEGIRLQELGYAASLTLRLIRGLAELPPANRVSESGPTLTVREARVVDLIAEELTNKEIALALSISPRTVKNHVHNVITKLRVSNRHEAVVRARQLKARSL